MVVNPTEGVEFMHMYIDIKPIVMTHIYIIIYNYIYISYISM